MPVWGWGTDRGRTAIGQSARARLALLRSPGAWRASPAMHILVFTISGMGCRRCIREVTGRLRDIPGVVTVTADVSRCRAVVSGTMTARDVLAAFEDSAHVVTLSSASDAP